MNALALLWQVLTAPLPTVDWSMADLLLRSSLALTAVLIVHRLLQRRSAALQHLAGLTGFIALLALPVAMSLVPSWLGILPATEAGGAGLPATATALARGLFWLWGVGTLVVFARLLFGQAFLARTFRRATPRGALTAALEDLPRTHGLAAGIEVRVSPEVDVPLAFGIARPRILLPMNVARWSRERLQVVLLHETAHLRRFDPAAQLVSLVACCLYWFHPLAWIASRHLALARERACDDLVLRAGSDADRYARQLVRIAEGLAGRRPPIAAVAMARPSQLRSRLTALLDNAADRRTVRLRDAALALAIGALLLSPLSAVRARSAASAPREGPEARAIGHAPGHRGAFQGHVSGERGHASGDHGHGSGRGHNRGQSHGHDSGRATATGHGSHSGHASGDHSSGGHRDG